MELGAALQSWILAGERSGLQTHTAIDVRLAQLAFLSTKPAFRGSRLEWQGNAIEHFSRLLELALVLVHLDHITRFIVNANHGIL
jgi:hypothetical protein